MARVPTRRVVPLEAFGERLGGLVRRLPRYNASAVYEIDPEEKLPGALVIRQGPGPAGGHRPLPPISSWSAMTATRTSFGGIEIRVRYFDVAKALERAVHCLEVDGDLRRFQLPKRRDADLLPMMSNLGKPWRGYDGPVT